MMGEKNRVAVLSVIAAVFLTTTKIIIGVITGSLGILSEALHSGLDLVAAAITWFSVRISDRPADRDHHYGHGKFENLSAFIQTILLLITCTWIIYEAINRLSTGRTHIEVNLWSYAVVITSIIIDTGRSRALYRVAKKHNSQALEADALHFSTDIWSSAVVLLGLVCANFGLFSADPVAALIVALLVLFISYRLGKRAINVLLDRAPDGLTREVAGIISSFHEVKYFHHLKIRASGPYTFIKVKVHLDSGLNLSNAHMICDRIEEEIRIWIPRCEVDVHAEPQDKEHLISDKRERMALDANEH